MHNASIAQELTPKTRPKTEAKTEESATPEKNKENAAKRRDVARGGNIPDLMRDARLRYEQHGFAMRRTACARARAEDEAEDGGESRRVGDA